MEKQPGNLNENILNKINSPFYDMNHKSRGYILVFNHEKFDPKVEQDSRNGTDVDVIKIEKCFKDIGFKVKIFDNLTLDSIRTNILKYRKKDHSNNDCFCIFVLSHGDQYRVYAKDASYDPALELWGQFTGDKCPSLAGKPKLFFYQTCQGSKIDPGSQVVLKCGRTEVDGNVYSFNMSVCADFLMAYASFEGYYSFRNSQDGSFWVTLLCEELEKNYENEDLQMILTDVQRRMNLEFISSIKKDRTLDGKKQTPYFKSSLTRRLIFGRKGNNSLQICGF